MTSTQIRGERRAQRDPQADQDNVNVRVSSAKDRAGGSRQQAEAVKVITPGPRGQQQNGIGNKMAQNFWISRYVSFGTNRRPPVRTYASPSINVPPKVSRTRLI